MVDTHYPEDGYGTVDDGKDRKHVGLDEGYDSSSDTSSEHFQAGVKNIEAISQTWSKWGLIIAYVSAYLMTNVTSLEGQTSIIYRTFAVNAFSTSQLLSSITVVSSVVYAVAKPVMGKVADVFGRLEAFCLTITLFVIGYIMLATSNDVDTFAGSQVFYSAGATGLQILIQIFIADTSNLINRAFFIAIPDLPFLWTVWAAPPMASAILGHYDGYSNNDNWRWGYGMWAIVLPAAFVPLFLALFINQRKAKKLNLLPPSQFSGMTWKQTLIKLWFDLDFFGLILLAATVSLILLPLTLAPSAKKEWNNSSMIAMIVIGCVLLPIFIFWERSPKLAPRALFPKHLMANRTVVAATIAAFFYFMAFYLSVQPYFYGYMIVVMNKSFKTAGYVSETFSFASSVTAITVATIIKYTKHYKPFIILGTCIYLMGIGLMIKYRDEGTSVGSLVGTQIAVGIGGGMFNVPCLVGAQAAVKTHQDVALVTAIWLTCLEIGGAVGSAISGAIWSSVLPDKLREYLPADAQANVTMIVGSIINNSKLYPVGSPERNAINRSYRETMHILLIVAVCIPVPMLIAVLFMKNFDLTAIDQKVKGRVMGGVEGQQGDSNDIAANLAPGVEGTGRERKKKNVSIFGKQIHF